MVGTREFFDAFSTVKEDQGLAPPRATDLGWAHGMMVNGDRQKIKCRYCHKVILGGGISRLKQHLAGERGNIAPCEKVPDDVKAQMQQHLGFKVLEKLKRQKESQTIKTPLISYIHDREEGNYDEGQRSPKGTSARGSIGRKRGKEGEEGTSGRRKRHKKQLTPTTAPAQPLMHLNFASQESMDQADMAVAKFMYDAGIPFSAANSFYFQLMADAIAAVGPGYKMPSYHSLRGKLLNKTVQETGELCQELKRSWEVTGCSVLVDRWTDRTDRTVLNFFAYCPKGTMFLRSVDATETTKSSEALLDLFDSIVQDVGPKNIVHFVTDTTPNYKAAGKALMNKYKTFFWSACAAHCIDLMLEEFGKMDQVKEVLARAKRISQFIYNHAWVLNLMRKKTGGRDIVRPAITRFATNFLALQSIVSLKDPLHEMFTSTSWMQSAFSKQRAGIEVAETVVDPSFWSLCAEILKVTKPLLTVLHLIDTEERPSMGYIYDAMEKARKGIIVAFNNKESEYYPYLKIIDQIWEEELHSPLHAAAYYLNPSIFYNPSFSTNKVIQKGLLDCIETLEPNLTAQEMITRHITFYEDAVGDFSRPVAVRGRESLAPATWWSLYAADYPDLQRFAIRISSQTCSGTRCERNWSMFERIHSKKRNRLEHERLNDLIFVHYNLRLQERQSKLNKPMARGAYDPICLEGMGIDAGDWVDNPGVLEGEDLGWMDVAVPSDSLNASAKLRNVNDYDDSLDDRGSDDTKGNDGSLDV
ncbi:PREDICTED: uncharacterized protein LOC104590486 isoform X2 [Nelumbo nucifera]|nr:PREDICTED: uncharacterized protein LOC104590486 isoform X2 [Nelumbo nucifera]XP_010247489.1 PREDICTED: uncharacterized protein LOC104590486 isoform X2 [Nelumbo nucifera]